MVPSLQVGDPLSEIADPPPAIEHFDRIYAAIDQASMSWLVPLRLHLGTW